MGLIVTGCSSKSNESSDTSVEGELKLSKEESGLPEYTLVLIDNTNVGNVIRETLHVVVEENYTLEQLYDITKKEALLYVSKNKVNALAIGFYENEDNIGNGYDMGRVEYVPYGDWTRAMDVKAGDYFTFQFVNHLTEPILSYLQKGTPVAEDKGETDVNLVKTDVESIYDGLEVKITRKNKCNRNT